MKVALELETLNLDEAPIRRRAVFARNLPDIGRVELTLREGGWTRFGRPSVMEIELPEPTNG